MPQTSLIPKKLTPRFQYTGESLGVFFRIALVLFLIAGAVTGGLFAYKSYVSANLNDQKSVLEKLKVEFEPSLITELEKVSTRIRTAQNILNNHTKLTSVFAFLENNTLTTTKFSRFAYDHNTRVLNMSGESVSYAGVAAQALSFRALREIEFANFSNFTLTNNGNVSFNVNMGLR